MVVLQRRNGEMTSVKIGAAVVEGALSFLCASGEARVCKCGVSLVSGMIGGANSAWCHAIASKGLG